MYDTAAMATTVKITPISQRPRLLSVSSVDSRPSPSSSAPPPTPPIVNHEAYTSRSDSFSDTIPSPIGIKLPHTRYMPIRSQSSAAVPSLDNARPSLARAPHSAIVTLPSFPSPWPPRSMSGTAVPRPSSSPSSSEEIWSRPLGNYSFCHSYEATCSPTTTFTMSDSRSGSRQSNHSKSSSKLASRSGRRRAKARGRSEGDCEHFSGWFRRLWRR